MADRTYQVEILNVPISFETISYINSVKLTEFSQGKKIGERYLGYLTKEDLYFSIERSHVINLDQAYVKDFSLSDYRIQRMIPLNQKINIKGWSSKSAFYDCDAHIDFSSAIIEDEANFSDSIFYHGKLNFTRTEFRCPLVDFSECKFDSHVTIFEHAKFRNQTINFEHARFGGESISFTNASFLAEETIFKRVNFGNARVKFQFAEFGTGSKIFERIRVNGPSFDFRRVTFGKGKVDFRRSMFGQGYVTFEESQITSGKLSFRMAYFDGGDLSFRRVDFGEDEANFDHVDFNNRTVSFEGTASSTLSVSNSFIRGNLDLRIKKSTKIDLSESYLYAITDLNFGKRDALTILSIKGVRNLGKIIVSWDENNLKQIIESSTTNHDDLANQFNVLKSNFSTTGQYNDEDKAYVFFKRHEHFSLLNRQLSQSKKAWHVFIQLGYFLRNLVFDKMGLYATSPSRVLVSMLIAIILFAGIYISFDLMGIGSIINSVDASDKLDVIDKSLYHSAITFFTIGYGDFYPTSFNRLISALEGWTGVFMMSYFTVAFVRKILR